MARRAKRPLNPTAVSAADDEIYKRHEGDPRPNALYDADGNRLPLSATDPSQAALRKEWMDLYIANGGEIESDPPAPTPPGAPVVPCEDKKCDCTVTIGKVKRGNPYVAQNAPDDGMPDSVPPSKTYDVEVTVTPSLEACPGQYVELSIINGSADNGTATVAPARITKTTTVTVTGGDQTKKDHGGQLKIQAKLDGATVKAESSGFTVCAHPINWRDAKAGDIDDPDVVGVVVQDDWDSDSGTFADLDETEISEVVEYDAPTTPPYDGAAGAHNSGYLPGNSPTQDTHTIVRPAAGPAAPWERRQVSIFKCHRCGADDKVQPNSGLKIIHDVFDAGGGHWKHHVRKIGAKVTARGYTSEAGAANVTSDDHDLP